AREKKIRILQEFLSQYPELSFCEAQAGRAEEFAQGRRGAYAVVIARALASLPSLVELASPLLRMGGHLIALKGQSQADEIARADQAAKATGLSLSGHRAYSLPSGEHRTVIVYEKINQAQLELPRQAGYAQRRPLA
ncbi:MAG: class I SAM-dependent methyltransferase, partial [Coriobacteriia bacterium]|nr:class I SAM-dependent methyltransferase [Coriobacteriia bacterium]